METLLFYLVIKLDSIHLMCSTFIGLSIGGIILNLLAYNSLEKERKIAAKEKVTEKEKEKLEKLEKGCERFWNLCILSIFFIIVLKFIIPSTKEASMILVGPKILKAELPQNSFQEKYYDLAELWLKNQK